MLTGSSPQEISSTGRPQLWQLKSSQFTQLQHWTRKGSGWDVKTKGRKGSGRFYKHILCGLLPRHTWTGLLHCPYVASLSAPTPCLYPRKNSPNLRSGYTTLLAPKSEQLEADYQVQILSRALCAQYGTREQKHGSLLAKLRDTQTNQSQCSHALVMST